MKIFVLLLAILPALAIAKFSDKSELGTTDMALCTAAVMKAGMGIDAYRPWANALDARYRQMYPKKSANEVDSYTSERIVDKRRELERRGLGTSAAFKKFYKDNCESSHP